MGEVVLEETCRQRTSRFPSQHRRALGLEARPGALSRTVFFDARCVVNDVLIGTDLHFFYRTRLPRDERSDIEEKLPRRSRSRRVRFGAALSWRNRCDDARRARDVRHPRRVGPICSALLRRDPPPVGEPNVPRPLPVACAADSPG